MLDCFRIKKKKKPKIEIIIPHEDIPSKNSNVPLPVPPQNSVLLLSQLDAKPEKEPDIITDSTETSESLSDIIDASNEFLHGFRIHKKFQASCNKKVMIVKNSKDPDEKYILKIKEKLNPDEYNTYKILSNRDHPNIQKVIMMWIAGNKYCSLYEYVKGIDLYEAVDTYGEFTESQIRNIIRQVGYGLEFLHDNNIVHVDLKCENILYDPSTQTIKIIDFDLSVTINPKIKYTYFNHLFGTEHYVAPESIHEGIYSTLTDVWQLGVVLYCLVTNNIPCENNLKHVCSDKCKNNMLDLLNKSIKKRQFDRSLYDLVKGMLEYDYNDRWNLDSVMKSEWMKKC